MIQWKLPNSSVVNITKLKILPVFRLCPETRLHEVGIDSKDM